MDPYPYWQFLFGIIVISFIYLGVVYLDGWDRRAVEFYLLIFLPIIVFLLNPFIWLLSTNNNWINLGKVVIGIIHILLWVVSSINYLPEHDNERIKFAEEFGIFMKEEMIIVYYAIIIIISLLIYYMNRGGRGGGGGGRGGGGGVGGVGGDGGGGARRRYRRMSVGNRSGMTAGAA